MGCGASAAAPEPQPSRLPKADEKSARSLSSVYKSHTRKPTAHNSQPHVVVDQADAAPTSGNVDESHFELFPHLAHNEWMIMNPARMISNGQWYLMKRMAKRSIVPERAEMVLQERQIMADVRASPFLVGLKYAFQTPTDVFLVCPLMRGNLGEYIAKRGAMSESAVQFYAAELLLALEYLQSKKVLFRNMCEDNILFDAEGHMALANFKLAVQLTPESHYSTSGKVGKRGWVAPEVLEGDYGFPSDVYALGVAVYFMAYGKIPIVSGLFEEELNEDDHKVSFHKEDSSASLKTLSLKQAERPKKNDSDDHKRPLTEMLSPKTGLLLATPDKTHSPEFSSFVEALLHRDPEERLTVKQAREHPWMTGVDWKDRRMRKRIPPYTPRPMSFRAEDEVEFEKPDLLPLSALEEAQFAHWDFRTDRLVDSGSMLFNALPVSQTVEQLLANRKRREDASAPPQQVPTGAVVDTAA